MENNLAYYNAQRVDAEGNADTVTVAVPYMSKIIFEKVHPNAVIPTYATEGDSGMDLHAVEDMYVTPGQSIIAKIGLKVEIPRHPCHEVGYRWEAQVRPRSGISAKTTLRVANAPGTIDNGYKGEIGVILTNIAEEVIQIEVNSNVMPGAPIPYVKTMNSDYVINLKGNRCLNSTSAERPNEIYRLPEGTIKISKGDKIAQLVFVEVLRPVLIEEGTVGTSDRGEGGFGSTGV